MRHQELRWKEQADLAVSPLRMEGERLVLSAAIACRLGGANRLSLVQGTSAEPFTGLVDDFYLRVTLAVKHLLVLEEARRVADYEDVPALHAEMGWAEGYFERMFQCPIPVAAEGQATKAALEGWYKTLAGVVDLHLQATQRSAA